MYVFLMLYLFYCLEGDGFLATILTVLFPPVVGLLGACVLYGRVDQLVGSFLMVSFYDTLPDNSQ